MATVRYTIKFTPQAGSNGTRISYKKEGAGSWTVPTDPANPTTLSYYPVQLDEGSHYYYAVTSMGRNCQPKSVIGEVTTPKLTPCCPDNYELAPDESYCFRQESRPPDIETQNLCVAPSKLSPAYSGMGTRLFMDGNYGLHLASTHFQQLNTAYWRGQPEGSGDETLPGNPPSPMNRESVWVDEDCDGIKDPLRKDAILQATIQIVSNTKKTVYIGIGGDNTFKVTVNALTVVDCSDAEGTIAGGGSNSQFNFTFWWIFPVELLSGSNYINFQFRGDGSVVDAAAFTVMDNTLDQIASATKDEDLTFLFRSSQLIGSRIDIATCPEGWILDTSGGTGNYVCRRILTAQPMPCH